MVLQECFFIWLTVLSVKCSTLNIAPNYFDNITFVLYEDVKFLSERLEQINVDTIFGLTLAEVHLSAALSSYNINFLDNHQQNFLEDILSLCKTACSQAKDKFFIENPHNQLMKALLQTNIWIHPIDWRWKFLKSNLKEEIAFPDHEVVSLIFNGTPQEPESDYCLAQLAEDDCKLSDTCAEILVKKDKSRGYPLTHRLLIIQAAKALQCKQQSGINYLTLVDKYCEQIFQDLIDLDSANFPSVSRDLAMEQITLCGMEGYLEFIDSHYIDLVISWRNSFGCYSALKLNQRLRHRSKKSTKFMDFGCDSHASGVAAAALSLFIRAYIEKYLTLTDEK